MAPNKFGYDLNQSISSQVPDYSKGMSYDIPLSNESESAARIWRDIDPNIITTVKDQIGKLKNGVGLNWDNLSSIEIITKSGVNRSFSLTPYSHVSDSHIEQRVAQMIRGMVQSGMISASDEITIAARRTENKVLDPDIKSKLLQAGIVAKDVAGFMGLMPLDTIRKAVSGESILENLQTILFEQRIPEVSIYPTANNGLILPTKLSELLGIKFTEGAPETSEGGPDSRLADGANADKAVYAGAKVYSNDYTDDNKLIEITSGNIRDNLAPNNTIYQIKIDGKLFIIRNLDDLSSAYDTIRNLSDLADKEMEVYYYTADQTLGMVKNNPNPPLKIKIKKQ